MSPAEPPRSATASDRDAATLGLDDYHVALPGAGEAGVQVGPNGHWLLTDAYLSDLCAVLVLRLARPGDGDRELQAARDGLRAIGRASLSLLQQEGVAVPVVCVLRAAARAPAAQARRVRAEVLVPWVLDASWHDGEAIYIVPPSSAEGAGEGPAKTPVEGAAETPKAAWERFLLGLLVSTVPAPAGLSELTDERLRGELRRLLDEASRRKPHLGALGDLRDRLDAKGAYDAAAFEATLDAWMRDLAVDTKGAP